MKTIADEINEVRYFLDNIEWMPHPMSGTGYFDIDRKRAKQIARLEGQGMPKKDTGRRLGKNVHLRLLNNTGMQLGRCRDGTFRLLRSH